MPVITIKKLSARTHQALMALAAQHGRSIETEICDILDRAVRPAMRLPIGSQLAALGERFDGVDLALIRDQSPTDPAVFD